MSLTDASFKILEIKAKGLISRAEVTAKIIKNTGKGIRFFVREDLGNFPESIETGLSLNDNEDAVIAHVSQISSTQRNTVLSNGKSSICLTEHFLAACALLNVKDIDVFLDQEELPFGDGSANLWLSLFKDTPFSEPILSSDVNLKEEIIIRDSQQPHKFIKAIPIDTNFNATYQMNWAHPKIGEQSFTWTLANSLAEEIANARTFSTEAENQILALSDWIVGITDTDFTMPLRFTDEPSRHKVLDLIGDLLLAGINPLRFKMQLISNQGGHHLNSLLAAKLSEQYA